MVDGFKALGAGDVAREAATHRLAAASPQAVSKPSVRAMWLASGDWQSI